MTKYIITDKNINYDSSYTNIPYFANETDRDKYVENNLLTDWKNKLSLRPELGKKINTNLSDTIQIQDTFENIMNKNYMIIEKDSKYYFYFINSIGNVNNKTFILGITKDLVMTYPAIFDKIKNVKLTQSHLNNYYGYQFDGGYKEVINVSNYPFLNGDNEVYNQLKNKGWLVVFERVNDESKYIPKIKNGNDYLEPFKIYVAPLTPLPVKGETSEVILYNQPEPVVSEIDNQTSSNPIILGLSQELDPSLTLNVYYRETYNGNWNGGYNRNTFSLTNYVLEAEQIIVLPFFNGNKNTALEATKQIRENGVYNNSITLNSSGSGNLYFLPVRLKVDGLSYTFELLKVSEMITYLPNANNVSDDYKDLNQDSYGVIQNQEVGYAFDKISELMLNSWSSDKLFNFLEDPEENANVITAKTTNFIPIDTNQTDGIIDLTISNNVLYDEDKEIYYLSSLNYDRLLDINTYSLDVSNISKYDLIEGLNKYSLTIENQKEFSLNPNFITDNKTIDFQHYASFTPDWEERFKYINGNYISLTNSDNSFINNKEFIKGTDILASYKVNNPVTSKLEWFKPAFSASNLGLGILKGRNNFLKENEGFKTLLKDKYNNFTPDYLKEQGIKEKIFNPNGLLNFLPSGISIFGDIASIGASRANMKRQPDEFTGNGDINGDLIFNENGIKFSLIEYDFITPERDSIIETIKRYGVTTNIFITNLNDSKIRQPSFNFIVVSELDNSNNQELIDLLSNEEYREFADILASGVRIWWDITKWKDFDSNE